MFIIGVSPYSGLFTEAQFRRGDIPSPGTRGQWTDPATGATREFIAVKFTATANRLNGSLVTIDPDGVATLGTVAEGGLFAGRRAGVLTYNASAIATQTMTGTHFGWAQTYGKGKALIMATVTASFLGQILEPAADGAVAAGAIGSASANLYGLTAAAVTTVGTTLMDVLLNYPQFQNIAG